MKICSQCSSVFPDDYVFCLTDGSILADGDEEQETVVQKRVVFEQPTSALSPDMLAACAACGLANRTNSKFCKKCGGALFAATDSKENETPPVDPGIGFPKFDVHPLSSGGQGLDPSVFQVNVNPSNAVPSPASGETVAVPNPRAVPPPPTAGRIDTPFAAPAAVVQRNRSMAGKIAFGGVLAAIVLVGGVIWFINQPHQLEAKLDKAIVNNQLLAPNSENAYEYYHQLKKDGVGEKILRKYEDRLVPLLTEKPNEVLKTVLEPGITEKRLEEWQDAAKMLEWASTMRPGDNQLAAKALYCQGRLKYLGEQKDAAVADWKKAADMDKKWALPLNGIGLVYNEQKDYEGARKWLLQAVEREPNWVIPYNNLGTSFYYQKRFSEALGYYQKALALSPRWARPHAWLASIAMENYDYQKAVDEFDKVLSPDAVGASELNLESIRKQREKAREMASYSAVPY